MTFDEALVAARLQAPVVFSYIDGCSRIEIECERVMQVGYEFKDGVQSEFAQVLDKSRSCVYNIGLKDLKLKGEVLPEGMVAV